MGHRRCGGRAVFSVLFLAFRLTNSESKKVRQAEVVANERLSTVEEPWKNRETSGG